MNPYKAKIEWIDHASAVGWFQAQDLIGERPCVGLTLQQTCCWVVYEDANKVVITHSINDQGSFCDPLAIAKNQIKTKLKIQ